MRGYVYFIGARTLSAVKIGFTAAHPLSRLKDLQTGCPARLKLLAYVEGSVKEERLLHKAFEPLHIHGEWFRHELKLADFIHYLDAPFGEASPRNLFDSAIADVIPSEGQFYPDPDNEIAYVESALWFPFSGADK